MRNLFLISLVCAAPLAAAPDWPLRAGEVALSRAEAVTLTTDRPLVYFDDGQSRYSTGGAYSYTYANGGGTAFGAFRVEADGRVCVRFRNGRGRCDLFVRKGARLILVTEAGERFPVRDQIGSEP